jgi:transposase-like protein
VGEDRTGATGADRRRLTVPQAAEALGVTVDAVRGRIRRGKLNSEQHAGTVYVWLDAPEEDDSRGPSATSHRPSDDQSERIEDFREQVAYLREQLQAERQAHAESRRLLMAALERIPPQIEAPQEAAEASETVEEEPQRAEPHPAARDAQEGAGRRWWRRWFGG